MRQELTRNLLDDLKQSYLSGLPAKVNEIESFSLALEKGKKFTENYAALYRAVHSLKGSGGTYGYHILTSICHQLEDWLGLVGSANSLNAKQADILLSFVDILADAVDKIRRSESGFADIERQLAALKKQSSQHDLHVLVIDTSAMNVRIVAEALALDPAHISVAEEGVGALARLMSESFDLVISSQEVGALNGSAMIAALKLSHGVSRHAKTILLTSNNQLREPEELQPDVVIKKDAMLAHNIAQSVRLLGLAVA